jgi:hypothetical protein
MPTPLTHATAPSLTLSAFFDPHGALLATPVVLLDLDSLPTTHRVDKSLSFFSNLDFSATAGPGFTGPWRACTRGALIAVEAVISGLIGTVYVQSSANGSTLLDSVGVGNLSAHAAAGLAFTTTQPYYRICVPVGENCRGSVRTQQKS